MFLSKLLVGGVLCVGCGVPVAFELLKGESVRQGEFVFSVSGGREYK